MGAMQSDPINPASASLHQNPFWVLWVSTRDPNQRIVELADEKALVLNPDDCESARATLTNPRKRLTAEMSWLPGVSPTRARQVATALKGGFADSALAVGLPPLARSNALSSAIELQPGDASPIELSDRIVAHGRDDRACGSAAGALGRQRARREGSRPSSRIPSAPRPHLGS